MLGRATGVCGGRAGSMNVVDLEHGLIGCFGIVGGSIAAATGAGALGEAPGRRRGRLLRRRRDQPGLLPRVPQLRHRCSSCRSSTCARTTSTASSRRCTRSPAGGEIAARAGAYGIPFDVVDGNDVWAVREAAREAPSSAPAPASGPTLLECQTYRHSGHSKSDPGEVPAGGRARAAGGSATRSTLARARLLDDGRRARTSSARGRGAQRGRADRARRPRRALAAPYPDPATRPRDGVRADRHERARVQDAIREALAEELERDESVIFFGEDVAAERAASSPSRPGLQERFGAERVFDTPISELALVGAAFGAAATGLRPVIEIMFGDFMALAMDSLVNQAAKLWYVSNEQKSVPLVVRSAVGAGGRFGAMHSQTHGTWFQGIPGLKVVAPSTPADAKGLLKAAIRDDNPVIFLEHKRLYSVKGEPEQRDGARSARPRIVREGARPDDRRDLEGRARRARGRRHARRRRASTSRSSTCARCGRSTPTTVLGSVEKTNRVLVVEEGPRTGGWAAGLLGSGRRARPARPRRRLDRATDETPLPYSPPLEEAFLPAAETIVESVRARLGTGVETSA